MHEEEFHHKSNPIIEETVVEQQEVIEQMVTNVMFLQEISIREKKLVNPQEFLEHLIEASGNY